PLTSTHFPYTTLFRSRYVLDEDNKGTVYVYTKSNIEAYTIENNTLGNLIEEECQENYFIDVPVCTYENNRQRIGDFEKVLSLIEDRKSTRLNSSHVSI